MLAHEIINHYRIAPRLMVCGYGILVYQVSQWFMALSAPTSTQAAFISTLVGASAAVFGLYTNSGGNRA